MLLFTKTLPEPLERLPRRTEPSQVATKRTFSVCVTMAGRGQIIPSCDRFAERVIPNHASIRNALSCNRCHDRSETAPSYKSG